MTTLLCLSGCGFAFAKPKSLFGKQVGTIVNYFYEKMDRYFEKGKITKEAGHRGQEGVNTWDKYLNWWPCS